MFDLFPKEKKLLHLKIYLNVQLFILKKHAKVNNKKNIILK